MTELAARGTPLERDLAGDATAPGATPLDAFRAARRHFVRGERIDMQELAAELGVSRATLYRWVGSRDRLIGEVLWAFGELQLQESRAMATGRGADRIVQIYEHYLTATAQYPPLRKFIESEPDAALRILWSGKGVVQRRLIDTSRGLLEEAVDAGELELRLPADDLAYVMVRIGESFSWREWITGEEPDVPKAAAVVRLLLT
jgi:AcrR family transcriptional regulator